MGSRSINAAGEIWEVIAVDERLLAAEDEASIDEEVPSQTGAATAPDDVSPGDVVTWQPMSWNPENCDADSVIESRLWDSESRSAITSPTAPRERTAVSVNSYDVPTGEATYCSGVVIEPGWILTAAHCFYDDDNNAVDENDIYIELHWANETSYFSNGAEVFFAPGFSPSGNDFDDDYALIKLGTQFSANPGEMTLSTHNDTVLDNVGSNFHNLGFPLWFPECDDALGNTLTLSTNNDVTGFFQERLRWIGDGSKGLSGSPVYFCPAGDDTVCASSDGGYVVSVFAGWSPTWHRWVGPRASFFRPWVIETIGNN